MGIYINVKSFPRQELMQPHISEDYRTKENDNRMWPKYKDIQPS